MSTFIVTLQFIYIAQKIKSRLALEKIFCAQGSEMVGVNEKNTSRCNKPASLTNQEVFFMSEDNNNLTHGNSNCK